LKRIAITLMLLSVVVAVTVLCSSHGGAWAQDRDAIQAPVSLKHWAGTDDLGRDRATRLALALLISSAGALAVAAVSTMLAVGIALGIVFGPMSAGNALHYIADVCLTLPWLFLLLLVRSVLPLNMSGLACGGVTLLLLAVLGWPVHVRGLCARLQATRDADWLLHARAAGVSGVRIAWRQVLPHLRSVYLTQFLICIPLCILAEADLGALGFGLAEPLVSWGTLLQDLASSAQVAATHWVYAPLCLLLVLLLSFEFFLLED
jgi:peptide/nickel transport system permease protein